MDKQALRERLYRLAKQVSAGDYPCVGICAHATPSAYSDEYPLVKAWLHLQFKAWPGYTGVPDFPVHALGSGLRPEDAYIELPLWRGAYGQARSRLLTFLIGQINVELAAEVQHG